MSLYVTAILSFHKAQHLPLLKLEAFILNNFLTLNQTLISMATALKKDKYDTGNPNYELAHMLLGE